jgi:hypothetical protein
MPESTNTNLEQKKEKENDQLNINAERTSIREVRVGGLPFFGAAVVGGWPYAIIQSGSIA